MLIDTHCHLALIAQQTSDSAPDTAPDAPIDESTLAEIQAIIARAQARQVTKLITIGSSLQESINSVQLAKQFPNVFASIGLHPNDCTQTWHTDWKKLTELYNNTKSGLIVAVGECGIDKHYPGYHLQRQYDAFKAQIEFALEQKLPLVVHTRDAADETLGCLQQYKGSGLRGVIHCFSESLAWAYDAINMGFVIGIGGAITYPKNNELRTTITTLPLDQIILETDAPFLPIQAMRGKKNEPQYIADIAAYIADLRGIPLHELALTTSATAQHLFGLTKN